MKLAPNESTFVVFRKEGGIGDTTKTNHPVAAATVEINKPWRVTFDAKMGGPAKPIVFETVTDWLTNASDSIKYYSRAAVYRNEFSIKKIEKGTSYMIEMAGVKNITKITVNGIEVGGVWTPPYRLDISKAIKKGE